MSEVGENITAGVWSFENILYEKAPPGAIYHCVVMRKSLGKIPRLTSECKEALFSAYLSCPQLWGLLNFKTANGGKKGVSKKSLPAKPEHIHQRPRALYSVSVSYFRKDIKFCRQYWIPSRLPSFSCCRLKRFKDTPQNAEPVDKIGLNESGGGAQLANFSQPHKINWYASVHKWKFSSPERNRRI